MMSSQKRNEKGQFQKGLIPWNKGKTYTLENHTNKTSFKCGAGHPHYRPIGSERVDRDGYIFVKVSDKKWIPKHRYLWEQQNGPVPKNHVVLFANGDKRDFHPDNLVLVSRAQLAVMNKNKLIFDDTELTKTGVLLSDLIMKINERRKE